VTIVGLVCACFWLAVLQGAGDLIEDFSCFLRLTLLTKDRGFVHLSPHIRVCRRLFSEIGPNLL
jgi:hypothetical protein